MPAPNSEAIGQLLRTYRRASILVPILAPAVNAEDGSRGVPTTVYAEYRSRGVSTAVNAELDRIVVATTVDPKDRG